MLPFFKIKPIGRRHSLSQDQSNWLQTLLFVNIKPVGHRRSFLSRSSQLIVDVQLVKTKPVDHKRSFLSRPSQLVTDASFCQDVFLSRSRQLIVDTSFHQGQANCSQIFLFVKIKPIDHQHLSSSRLSQLVANAHFR